MRLYVPSRSGTRSPIAGVTRPRTRSRALMREPTKTSAPNASQIGPAMRAASCVRMAKIQITKVSGAPISAANGTSVPRMRTLPGARYGRGRSGSV